MTRLDAPTTPSRGTQPLRGLLAVFALEGLAPTVGALDSGIGREVERLDARSHVADEPRDNDAPCVTTHAPDRHAL